jgi:RimJ/RimL family protein N-acetyltransferase
VPAIELPPDGLVGERVVIRPYRREDAALLAAEVGDPAVARYAAVPWAKASPAELEERIETTWPAWMAEGRVANLSIRDLGSDELLGHLVAFGFDWAAGRAEVGYWVRAGARGRGVGSDAVARFSRYAFEELGFVRLQAATDVENVASQRLLERAGFRQEGVMRSYGVRDDGTRADFFLYSRIRDER